MDVLVKAVVIDSELEAPFRVDRQRRLERTGMIPLVRSVGYEYASLLSVFDKIFWRLWEIERPSAVADEGMAAAWTWRAHDRERARNAEIILGYGEERTTAKESHNDTDRKNSRHAEYHLWLRGVYLYLLTSKDSLGTS